MDLATIGAFLISDWRFYVLPALGWLAAVIGKTSQSYATATDRVVSLLKTVEDFLPQQGDSPEQALVRKIGLTHVRRKILRLSIPADIALTLLGGCLVLLGAITVFLGVAMIITWFSLDAQDFMLFVRFLLVVLFFLGAGTYMVRVGLLTCLASNWRDRLRERAAVQLGLLADRDDIWSIERCMSAIARSWPSVVLIPAAPTSLVDLFGQYWPEAREQVGAGPKVRVLQEIPLGIWSWCVRLVRTWRRWWRRSIAWVKGLRRR